MIAATNNKNGKSPSKYPTKILATGAIDELKSNVYSFGGGHQGNQFSKTSAAIAGYCRREYGKAMSQLIKRINSTPQEPSKPTKTKKEKVLAKQ